MLKRFGALWLFMLPSLFVLHAVAVPASTSHIEQAILQQSHAASDKPGKGFSISLFEYFASSSRKASKENAPELDIPVPVGTNHMPTGQNEVYLEQIVVRFTVRTSQELQALQEASVTMFLDVWEVAYDWVDIRLEKNTLPYLLDFLPASLQGSHRPLFTGANLTEAVAATYPQTSRHRELFSPVSQRRRRTLDMEPTHSNEFFREYRPLPVIQSWMRLLQALFPTHSDLVTVGRSWQGRDINGIRVRGSPLNDEPSKPRKTIIISGGSHAREWVSVSTVNFILYSLMTGIGKSQRVDKLLQEMDMLLVPTLNPDGYVHSWEVDRLWRKTRQPTPIPFCQGIDLDRSWGFQWDASVGGSSANPCSEDYAGEKPFESVETKSFASFLRNETDNGRMVIAGMVDLHSYSESVLMPYSFSCFQEPPSLEDLEELGEGISRAIRRVHGEDYQVLSACEANDMSSDGQRLPRLQSAGGNPLDFFYHDLQVKYSYQIKLRDTGTYGFLLPPEWIVPQGEEIFSAILHLGKALGGRGSMASKGDYEDT